METQIKCCVVSHITANLDQQLLCFIKLGQNLFSNSSRCPEKRSTYFHRKLAADTKQADEDYYYYYYDNNNKEM